MAKTFDIETVRQYANLSLAPEQVREAWSNFSIRKYPDMNPEESYLENAALYPEFGKIVCISVTDKTNGLRSFSLDDKDPASEREKRMLERFTEYVGPSEKLIGHYIKKFDIPFVAVRMVANGLKVTKPFKQYGVKPWESVHLDTWEIWRGGNYGTTQASSLECVCAVLGIESPKAEFSGKDVGNIFYSVEPDALERIVKYCERDTLATYLVALKLHEFGMI